MSDKITICNMALSALRARHISRLDELSNESISCTTHYDAQLQATLRDHPWNFSTQYARLALSDEDAPPNWAYAYGLPSDCVLARLILPAVKGGAEVPFERAGDFIYCDQAESWLCYSKAVTDPVKFDPLFSIAFSLRLATAIAPDITADRGWVQAAQTQYINAISSAKAADGSEGTPETPRDPAWISAAGIDTSVIA